jgi:hypothetical protein
MWHAGEIVTEATADRNRVWEQLRERKDLQDLTHFKVVQGDQDLSHLQRWPLGTIGLWALLFTVDFRVEFMEGRIVYKSAEITPEHQVQQVWNVLCTENPEIQGERTFGFHGKVRPGLTVRAEIRRGRVFQTVTFQLINRRELVYEHREIWNM